MDLNEFKSTVTSSFSILSNVISQLRSAKSDPYLVIQNSNRAITLENLRLQISTINKYSFIHYPNLYTTEEKNELYEKIITIGNFLTIIQSSPFDDLAHEKLEILSEELIKYVRIAQLIKETDQNEKATATLENKAKEELLKINNIKNDIEIKLAKAQDILSNSTEAHENIIKLVTDLKRENDTAIKKGNEISHVLAKSLTSHSNIEVIQEALSTAKITLDDLYERSRKLQSELVTFLKRSQEDVEGIINKTEMINKLDEEISKQKETSIELLNNAKAAMNLAGTYRLSRHFKTAYQLAKSNRKFWATTSILSALSCIGFVIYILYEMNKVYDATGGSGQESHLILLFIARLSMIPILIGFFAFSAVQYVKQNNISEDYAHKKLLSETLISFKQEIGSNESEKVGEFMDNILKNVLSSPLNSNDKKHTREEVKSINELISTTMQINKEIIARVMPEEDKSKSKEKPSS